MFLHYPLVAEAVLLNSSLAESTPSPRGPETIGWGGRLTDLPPSALVGWPFPVLDLSVGRDFRPRLIL